MSTVASDEYMSIPKASKEIGISEARIRYYLMRDPKFPRGLRAGKPVVKPSAVAEYFRQLDTVQEVSGEYDGDSGKGL